MAITIKSKIVVIGAGNVGEAIGYTLMLRRQASDIVLVDLNEKRAKGSALDIAHGTAFSRRPVSAWAVMKNVLTQKQSSSLPALPVSPARPVWILQKSM